MSIASSAAEAAKVANRLGAYFSEASKYGLRTRTQIIDPQLCSDVLTRLRPSLERHRGCTLIDVNPGLGLWSEYLHKVVKPRQHILADPSKDFYKPYIEPLLRRHKNTMLTSNMGLGEILHSDHFFGKVPLKDELELMTTVNNDILVTINLAGPSHHNLVSFRGRQDQYFWNNMWASLVDGMRDDIFHRGLIRILAWVPDEAKYSIVPRSAEPVTHQSVQLQMIANVTEVAGGSVLLSEHAQKYRRPHKLEIADLVDPGKPHPETNLSATRIDLPPLPAAVDLQPNVTTLANTDHIARLPWLDRLIELDQQVMEIDPVLHEDLELAKSSRRRAVHSKDPVIKEWLHQYSLTRTKHAAYQRQLDLINEQRAIEAEWRAIPSDDDPRITVLKERAAAVSAQTNKMRNTDAAGVRKHIDSYRLYDNKASHWCNRTYNPIVTHPREFANATPTTLALLDIQPRPEFRQTFDTEIKHSYLSHVLAHFCSRPATPMYELIESLLDGSGTDDFVATVPNLRNVRMGGWYNLHDLRPRTLSSRLWQELALAYAEWPFRLSIDTLTFGMKNAKKSLELHDQI
jgi:mitochondrial transcription factor 1